MMRRDQRSTPRSNTCVAGGAVTAVVVGAAAAAPSDSVRRGALAPALAPIAIAAIIALPLEMLAAVLVVASQMGGLRVRLAGFHFLPEHFAVIGLIAALFFRYRRTLMRRPAVFEVLLLAWVLWNALTSVAFSVETGKSLAVVGWMLLAWLILWSLRSWFLFEPIHGRRVLQSGMVAAAAVGWVAFALWVAALVGLFRLGVQHDFVSGTVAARGLSVEANLFGSLELCWLFVAVRWRVVNDFQVPRWEVVGLLLGIISSMTRAVWLATILVVTVSLFGIHERHRQGVRVGPGPYRGQRGGRALVWFIGGVLLVVLAAPAAKKFQAIVDFGSSTGGARVKTWKVAVDDLTASHGWLLGRGTNSFGQRHLSLTVAGQPDYLGNLPLTLLYDTGLVGLILFAGAMVAFVFHRHIGWGRLFKLLFVITLMIVGAAASPIWFGYVWVTVAAIGAEWQREHFDDHRLSPALGSGRPGSIDAHRLAEAPGPGRGRGRP